MNEKDIVNKYKEWASVKPSEDLLSKAISFLECQQAHLEKE